MSITDSMLELTRRRWMAAAILSLTLAACAPMPAAVPATNPLPSWNAGAAKAAHPRLRHRPSPLQGGPDHVPPAERIAVFDNDGTLWCEQPMYVQLAFVFDRVKALAPKHPEWKGKEPFEAALAGDLKAVAAGGEKAAMQLLMATHAAHDDQQLREGRK